MFLDFGILGGTGANCPQISRDDYLWVPNFLLFNKQKDELALTKGRNGIINIETLYT